MTPNKRVHIIIVGCGRVGMELALSVHQQGHSVAVMDASQKAFDRLGLDFGGRTIQGDALDRDALKRAGIESAHGLAAVTSSDSANIITARVARDVFKIDHVVARVYDPARAPIYELLGLQTVASSSWGAQRMEQLLLHPGLQSVYSAGNGEVQIYEVIIPEAWQGQSLSDLVPASTAVAAAITRGGRGLLPTPDLMLQADDVLQVSATAEGAASLRQRIRTHGKE
jgi:trk system potassium uptake protein